MQAKSNLFYLFVCFAVNMVASLNDATHISSTKKPGAMMPRALVIESMIVLAYIMPPMPG